MLKVAVFSTKKYDQRFLEEANQGRLDLHFFEARLDLDTCPLADKFPVVCTFVNDDLGPEVLLRLFGGGTRMIALRCAGYNNVNFYSVKNLGLVVARVPAYSPLSISEFTIGIMINLTRKIWRAINRAREGNFSLQGLLGFNIAGHTVGVVGSGKIGAAVAEALSGFQCRILLSDPYPNPDLVTKGYDFVSVEQLFRESDLITLHCPLTDTTRHMVNRDSIATMKQDVMIVNTSRGALIDTEAVTEGLKEGKIAGLAIDVYEEEADIFFEDRSDSIIQDDSFTRLLHFPNVIVTGHLAFFTIEAMRAIASQTIDNILAWHNGESPPGLVTP
ncbi:MAG: 2-hydroxyacid dehydrogenase [Planctomycetia bacterium]|nr:2-hydroxyacid dehydrogenase [Planctomycetia bacterium]